MIKVFEEKFNQIKTREIERGVTLIGPHRDDLIFYVMVVMFKRLVHKDNNVQQLFL